MENTVLKRNRPKNHSVWYISIVSASLLIGITVVYVIHTVHATKTTITEKPPTIGAHLNTAQSANVTLSVNKFTKVTTKPKSTANLQTITKKTQPLSRTLAIKKSKPLIRSIHFSKKKRTIPVHPHVEKKQEQVKSPNELNVKVQTTTTTEPPTSYTKNPSKKNNKNSIRDLLDQVTHPVHSLLTNL